MKLDISKAFLHPEESFPFETEVFLDKQSVLGEYITFDPVKISGTYRLTGEDKVIVEGEMSTRAHGICALCLSEAAVPVQYSFSEIFSKDADETEGEAFAYQNKELPLDHLTLTLVLLHMPMRILCEGGCGQDRDISRFLGHIEEKPHPEGEDAVYYPFAGLKDMLEKEN